jgi:transcriptional regulator with XRE-family HTH domain
MKGDNFAIRLTRAQGQAGLNMFQLAKEAGLHHSTLSQYVSGVRENPTMNVLVCLARALNVSTDYLCGLEERS